MIGKNVGLYRVLEKVGEGGMGEVYRAQDTRLGREVAIKILPAAFTSDPDRLARFEREARVLALLNHPNIATIHGLEESEGVRALVLELVEGETLAERIETRGAFQVEDALAIGRQIADALDAAHERGIVHRDLKPANIKITPEGIVKVLDFGIAKAVQRTTFDRTLSEKPTLTETQEGVILGTATYMSPEQARGQPVDKRTDIWAFGCVLFEMLTARPPFHGETMSDIIARILRTEPDWATVSDRTPAAVVGLLRRCLEKDPKRRLRDLGDLDAMLDVSPSAQSTRARSRWLASAAVIATTAVVTLALTLLVGRLRETPAPAPPPIRFELPVPVKLADSGVFAVSPDGRHLAFAGTGADGILRLWIRALDTLESRPIVGTEGKIANNSSVFWSPDSRFIAFYESGKIRRVDRSGGEPQTVCDVTGVAIGGTWNRDGLIVAGSLASGLIQCPASGGVPRPVTIVKSSDPTGMHMLPSFLPDGRHILYFRVSRANPSTNGLYLADLSRPPEEQPEDRVIETGFGGTYAPSPGGGGRILFVRNSGLWAVPFDAERLAISGTPVQIAPSIGSFRDFGLFGAAADTLVYRGAIPDFQVTWRDRKGADLGAAGDPGVITGVALSPDATRAVVLREIPSTRSDFDLWLIDLQRNTTIRFTSDPFLESMPTWSADGKSVIYGSGQGSSSLHAKPVDGAPPRVLLEASATAPFSINPLLTTMSATADGRLLVFSAEARGPSQSDLWIIPVEANAKPAPLLQQPFNETHGSISPDGTWLAYVSNESGVNEVFVRPLTLDPTTRLPSPGAATLISRGGGIAPRWRADSRELFYQSLSGSVMAARVAAAQIDNPLELFKSPGMLPHWGVAPDGQRFLLAMPVRQLTQAPFTVVVNWQTTLGR